MRYLLVIPLLGLALWAQILLPISAGGKRPNTPTDSPGAGTYGSTQSVTLSDAGASTILYTTDGSTPACPATGTLYTGAFNIAATTTLKAIGCNGVTGGGVLSSVYTISSGISVVQTCTGSSADINTSTCVFSSSVTNGNTIAVFAGAYHQTGTPVITSIADTIGNTYVLDESGLRYTNRLGGIAHAKVTGTTGANTITVTWTSGGTYGQNVHGYELAGVNATTPVGSGQHACHGNEAVAGTDVITSTAITTTANGDFILGGVADENMVITLGTNFTNLLSKSNGSYATLKSETEYLTQSASGSIAATFTPNIQNPAVACVLALQQ